MDLKKTSGMGDGNVDELLKVLAEKPELTQRFLAIAKLAGEPGQTGRIRSADEVESLLIEEVRKLGNETLASWAQGVDSILGEQLKVREEGTRMREKKR